MRILLISAYHAASHKAWADTLIEQLPQHQWQVLSLPDHYFSWRIRGNAYSIAFSQAFTPMLQQSYDLVLATSMTDVVGLKAFCPQLASLPWLLYFHENQFAYPFSKQQQGQIEMQMVTLYSALAADYCLFNSAFNQRSFIDGAKSLLKKLPDYNSSIGVEQVADRSAVLSVPLKQDVLDKKNNIFSNANGTNSDPKPLHIIWAARWEYDKGPDRLLAFIEAAKSQGLHFCISILGERFRRYPDAFDTIQTQHQDVIAQFGFLESRAAYLQALAQGDIFLSTALHEFQGLALLEAVALGCRPLLPNRQVYPEWFIEDFLYPSCDDIQQEATAAVSQIPQVMRQDIPDVSAFYPQQIAAQFEQVLQPFYLPKGCSG